MAWNEPGGGKDNDPWGSRKKGDGPPDLDEIVRKMQDKFSGLFGGRKGGKGGKGGGFGFGMLILIALLVWMASGIYIVDQAEEGVVLRFGKYTEKVGPGPHWHLPYPIETVQKVNSGQIRSHRHSTQMLTKDVNLIEIELVVQYRVADVEKFLFRVRSPVRTLEEATESALREVIGKKKMDDFLSGGRAQIIAETKKKIQIILNEYQTGLAITNVSLQRSAPPREVKQAFEDAINAEEDEIRYRNQAETYARGVVPKAEGARETMIREAEAYRQQIVDKAKGETSRFLATLKEYRRAPEVTRKRMYLATMEYILSRSSKVLVRLKHGNNIMYLPLDRLVREARQRDGATGSKPSGSSEGVAGQGSGYPDSGNRYPGGGIR